MASFDFKRQYMALSGSAQSAFDRVLWSGAGVEIRSMKEILRGLAQDLDVPWVVGDTSHACGGGASWASCHHKAGVHARRSRARYSVTDAFKLIAALDGGGDCLFLLVTLSASGRSLVCERTFALVECVADLRKDLIRQQDA